MDMEKILKNLWERANSTDFENEREICLQKIERLKAKYPFIELRLDSVDNFIFINCNERYSQIPIEQLREIFLETYFSYYLDENFISKENVPVQYDYYLIEMAKHRMDETIRNFPNNKKLYKFYCELMEWLQGEKAYFKTSSISRAYWMFGDRHFFIFLDLPTAYFIEALSGYNDDGLDAFYEKQVARFNEHKKELLDQVRSGYWDNKIRDIFDPTLLPES